jgi:hypothetical protein
MSGPTVTVIIPCYNLGEYVGQAVRSALAQEGALANVLLIDDGSTDPRTIAALDEIARRARARLLRTPNRGVAAARNLGLEQASGEFVLFLDADDRLRPGALATMTAALAARPDAAVAYPAFVRMDNGQTVHRPEWNRFAALFTNTLSIASLVRRAKIGKARFRAVERPFEYEDWDFWLQLTERAPAVHTPQPLYDYRVRPGSRGQAGNRHHREVIADLRRLNAEAYSPAALMAAKRAWAPAVSVAPATSETAERWRRLLDVSPWLDAELVEAGETALGKYVLHDDGSATPRADAFRACLAAAERGRKLDGLLPLGWRLNWRRELADGPDPTRTIAERFAAAGILRELASLDELLWRLSCPAWTEPRLPRDADELAGEPARAAFASERLQRHALTPYAVFGAGMHTTRLLEADCLRPRPAVILDDFPSADELCGVPIRRPSETMPGLRAILVSSDAHERALFRRALAIAPAGKPILRLYS